MEITFDQVRDDALMIVMIRIAVEVVMQLWRGRHGHGQKQVRRHTKRHCLEQEAFGKRLNWDHVPSRQQSGLMQMDFHQRTS